jgi:RNA polymerase sigma-70 factor (ECF subfamily)
LNDLDIYEILVREHEQMLFGYLLAFVRDPDLADDLAQRAFVRAYQNLSTLKDRSSFAPWLRSIARNVAINDLKRRAREVPTDPEVLQGMEDVFHALDAPDHGDSWADRVQAVKLCFEKLSEKLRRTCQLHYLEDMKAKDVAQALSMSLSAVLKSLERGRAAIRRCVEMRLGLGGVS